MFSAWRYIFLLTRVPGAFRRWCIWGSSDLNQTISGLLDLVLGAWAAHRRAVAANLSGVVAWCCLLLKIKALQNRRETGNSLHTGSGQSAVGKYTWAAPSAAQSQGSQMLKESKNCSLSIFLSLSYWNGYLIEPFVAWPFYWDPERALLFQYHIPFPSAEHQAGPRGPKPC